MDDASRLVYRDGMNQAMKPVWVLFAALVLVVAVSLLVKASRPGEIIPWRPTLAAARDEARSAHKPVLVYFTASWCGPCQNLKHTTWADKNVDAALRDYIPVKVDINRDPELAEKYGVQAVPTFAMLGPEGQPLRQAEGAMPPEEFIAWLRS